MVNEVEKDLDEEEKYEKEEYPLSPADWIVFLSGEISDHRTRFLMLGAIIVAGIFTCIGCVSALAVTGTIVSTCAAYLFLVYIVVLLAVLFWKGSPQERTIEHLEKIREDIIYEELKNYGDILKRCEDAGIFKCKND